MPPMGTLFADTSSDIEQILITRLRTTPSWRKIEWVLELRQSVLQLALAGLRERHPDADADEIHRLLAELILGSELAQTVYGPISSCAVRQVAPSHDR